MTTDFVVILYVILIVIVIVIRQSLIGRQGIPCPYGTMCSQLANKKAGQSIDTDTPDEEGDDTACACAWDISAADMRWLVEFGQQSSIGTQSSTSVPEDFDAALELQESHVHKLAEWLKPEIAVSVDFAESAPLQETADLSMAYIEATAKPCPACGK